MKLMSIRYKAIKGYLEKVEMYFNKQENQKHRMDFVIKWAEYVRTHPDKEWSRQQNILINSLFNNAKNSKLTKEEYLKIKAEIRK